MWPVVFFSKKRGREIWNWNPSGIPPFRWVGIVVATPIRLLELELGHSKNQFQRIGIGIWNSELTPILFQTLDCRNRKFDIDSHFWLLPDEFSVSTGFHGFQNFKTNGCRNLCHNQRTTGMTMHEIHTILKKIYQKSFLDSFHQGFHLCIFFIRWRHMSKQSGSWEPFWTEPMSPIWLHVMFSWVYYAVIIELQ